MDEWVENTKIVIERLKKQKKRSQELAFRLRYKKLISESEYDLFLEAAKLIDDQINTLMFDLLMHELLQEDITYEEYLERLKKYGKSSK